MTHRTHTLLVTSGFIAAYLAALLAMMLGASGAAPRAPLLLYVCLPVGVAGLVAIAVARLSRLTDD